MVKQKHHQECLILILLSHKKLGSIGKPIPGGNSLYDIRKRRYNKKEQCYRRASF